jgi:hypothetical protein
MADVAERAAAGALVAHDHEGRRALAEALADVGAGLASSHTVTSWLSRKISLMS